MKTIAGTASSGTSYRRLAFLMLGGILLVGGAWGIRSSRWLREPILRGKSVIELEAIVRGCPDDALANYYLAKQYYLQHRFPEARTAYEAAVHLEPDSARNHLGLGLTLYEVHEVRLAKEELHRALQFDPRLAWAEFMLGKIAWQEGDIQAALPHVKRATEIDPRSDPAWYGLGACYLQLNRYNEAFDAIQQAVLHKDANPRYHTVLGEIHAHFSRMSEAKQQYERALQLDPNYGPACGLLGGLLLKQARPGDSLKAIEELLLRASNLPTYRPQDVFRDLGDLYLRKNKYPEAIAALNEAIRKEPADERTYYQLIKVYRKCGNPSAVAETEKRFREVSEQSILKQTLESKVKRAPNDALLRLQLARLYREMGFTAEALKQYREAALLQPQKREAVEEAADLAIQKSSGLDQDFNPELSR